MSSIVDVSHCDTIIVGSGIAGLTTALTLGNCTIVSKTAFGAGSSQWAQGGIAAAIGSNDDPRLHAFDTLSVSRGLGHPAIAELVSGAAPDRVRWLLSLGTEFDTDDTGALELGREAGHRRRRILHTDGDRTGAEVMRALIAATEDRDDIDRLDNTFVVDLIRDEDRVVGVLARTAGQELIAVLAQAVVLATGGIGRVYACTTNPPELTGDGLAMAARAGAVIRDPEFVQFHPTALDTGADPMPLLTEALRGEGAQLIDGNGHRYMVDVHPDAELAPRDIVARENWQQLRIGPIFLDATMVGREFPDRFATAWTHAQRAGIDPRTTPLPVAPAQHYHMGGIESDQWGRTSLPGLWVCGEAASTGLNGANRLASNSLLEGLVFGTRVAESIAASEGSWRARSCEVPASALRVESDDDPAVIERLRWGMWMRAGIVRDEAGLRCLAADLAASDPAIDSGPVGRNLAAVARLVIDAALARTESRGGHQRVDHPGPRTPRADHTVVRLDGDVRLALPISGVQSLSS